MNKKTLMAAWACVLTALPAAAQTHTVVQPFDLQDVRLTAGDFKHAEDLDVCYLLALDPDRLLAPYLKEAGLTPKADNYVNWENTGLDGHIGGHYLSALSAMYAATGHDEVKTRLDYMMSELERCQQAAGDGYLCGVPGGRAIWKEIAEGNIKASSFGLNNRWVPLYNIHKTFAGLRDVYLNTGDKRARKMLVQLADWMMGILSPLTDAQLQDMLRSEHGGLNEVYADVYALTGRQEYVELARRLSHRAILDPLLQSRDELTGKHANTQIPKVIGFKRIADVTDDAAWDGAARFFWQTVVEHRSVSIGGNSVREHFHPADDFSSMMASEQGPETCNTYNMLRLTKMLYTTTGDSRYMDFYERAMYNHILSTINPVQGGFVYFTPMRPGHYRVYSQPQTSFWCCVGSGMENHAKYGEMIYGHDADNLYVNLFVPSRLTWDKVEVEQQTTFPAEEGTTLVFSPKRAKHFGVRVRVPGWTDATRMQVSVNGEHVTPIVDGGYLEVRRTWQKGDRLTVTLPMSLHLSPLPDGKDYVSFMYGPMVLAASIGRDGQTGLYADESRGGHVASGDKLPLQSMPVVVSGREDVLSHIEKVEGKPLTFRLTGVSPASYEGIQLKPFAQLHECRYIVYWPTVSESSLREQQDSLARAEQARVAMDARTLDMVICGEQQPESDHFVKMDKCKAGADGDSHWRQAEPTGWFAYTLNRGAARAMAVRITYEGEDHTLAAVYINGQEVGRIGGQEKGRCTKEVTLSDVVIADARLELKVMALGRNATPKIYEIRLLK